MQKLQTQRYVLECHDEGTQQARLESVTKFVERARHGLRDTDTLMGLAAAVIIPVTTLFVRGVH